MPNNEYNDALLKDRGNIKWTPFMLPEHRVALHEWERSQSDVEPPSYDEYELAELAEKIARAMHEGYAVSLRYWKAKRHHDVVGVVKRIDPIQRAVLIVNHEDDKRWIPAIHIVSIEYRLYLRILCVYNGK